MIGLSSVNEGDTIILILKINLLLKHLILILTDWYSQWVYNNRDILKTNVSIAVIKHYLSKPNYKRQVKTVLE